MMSFTRFRPSVAVAAAAMAFLSACATDNAGGPLATSTPTVSAAVLAGNSFVIVSDFGGGFAGSFTNYVANNLGRDVSDFWANASADFVSIEKCNAGFYAAGDFSTTCKNDAPNSDAGSVANVYTKYLSDGTSGKDATAFMFNGGSTYTVTLRGSYAGEPSEVGWFTKGADGYKFNKVTGWSDRIVGSTATINTMGQDWGFYIRNGFNLQFGGCAADPKTHCSDAEGGFAVVKPGDPQLPLQQFALFSNKGGNRFLVGVEDNKLELLGPNNSSLDSDYNDFLLEVIPERVCDFVTFGRLVTEVGGKKVVISGNAGGNAPGGGILGEFHIDIGGVDYHVSDIDSYGPVTSGALFGLPNARVFTGIAKNGTAVELRLQDSGEPGKGTDWVYVMLGTGEKATFPLGTAGKQIDQGNMQYHPTCRGPK